MTKIGGNGHHGQYSSLTTYYVFKDRCSVLRPRAHDRAKRKYYCSMASIGNATKKSVKPLGGCLDYAVQHIYTVPQSLHTYLGKARLEVKALSILVHRSQVPVKRGLVTLRPPTLAGGTAALEHVLQLLGASTAAKNGLTKSKLRC